MHRGHLAGLSDQGRLHVERGGVLIERLHPSGPIVLTGLFFFRALHLADEPADFLFPHFVRFAYRLSQSPPNPRFDAVVRLLFAVDFSGSHTASENHRQS